MNEDIMKAIEQAAAQAEQNQDRENIEAYINKVAMRLIDSAHSHLATSNASIPEPTYSQLEKWQVANRSRVSLQIGQVARIILRKELLGE